MNTKTRLILIAALLGISAIVLAVVFMPRGQAPTPATTPPPTTEPSGTTGASAASGATIPPDETALLATSETTAETIPLAGATVEPGTQTATSAPSPTLTKEEVLAQTLAQSGGQFTSSVGECSEILKTEDWCGVIKGTVRIIRSEWKVLFPEIEFYVVRRDLYGGEFVQQRNLLIVEHDGQRYTADTFDRLLKANGVITITNENRELVAKAFALMTIPDYLEEEIVFTEWEKGDWPASFGERYNYRLTAWTRILGLRPRWNFIFRDGRLREADGGVLEYQVGDYIDVPNLMPPSRDAFLYSDWGR